MDTIGFTTSEPLQYATTKKELAVRIYDLLQNGGFDVNQPGDEIPDWACDDSVTRFVHRGLKERLDAFAFVYRVENNPWNVTRVEIAWRNRDGLFSERICGADQFLNPHMVDKSLGRRPSTLQELKNYFRITR